MQQMSNNKKLQLYVCIECHQIRGSTGLLYAYTPIKSV